MTNPQTEARALAVRLAKQCVERPYNRGTVERAADVIATALREAHEAGRREQAQWRPIESAPRDGTVVDLWADGRRHADMEWLSSSPMHPHGAWMPKDSSWQDAWGWLEPTHWLPLPQPPAEAEAGHE